MKIKNIIALALVVLTLGVLFTGCSNNDTPENAIGAGDDMNTENATASANVADDTVDDILAEDSAEQDVEIGSLI